MTEKNKYVPKVGDFVTVVKYINSDNKSYSKEVLKVLAIDENLFYCDMITHKGFQTMIDINEVILRQVSKDFVLTIINNRD